VHVRQRALAQARAQVQAGVQAEVRALGVAMALWAR